jgi:hypothetical protein
VLVDIKSRYFLNTSRHAATRTTRLSKYAQYQRGSFVLSFSSNNNATSDIPAQLPNQVPEITSPLTLYDHPDVYEAIFTPLCPTFLLCLVRQ